MTIILFMKMILIVLFMSDFCLGITNKKNAMFLKVKIKEKLKPVA